MSDSGASDDEFQAPHNATSDEVLKHDDFDYGVIFEELSMEAPTMDQIFIEAKKFGDAHRFLINKFVFEATMRTKKMNLIFARYVTTVKFKKHPEAVMKIQSNPEESKKLSRQLIKTMNSDKGKGRKPFKPWRFVISTDEKTPNEYVTMTGCTQNSTIISDASDMKKEERHLMLTILEQMMRGDGTVPLHWAHDQIKEASCKMVESRYDDFISKMGRLQYFYVNMDSETLEITPRVLVELEPWLRAKLVGDLKICDLCRKIIARSTFTAECTKCKTMSHFNCFKQTTEISKKDDIECSKCKTMLTLDEVKQQIETRKSNRTSRPPTRTSRNTRNASPTPNDPDTSSEDVTAPKNEPVDPKVEDSDESL